MNTLPVALIKDLLIGNSLSDADWTIDLPREAAINPLKKVKAGAKVVVFRFAPTQFSSLQPVGQG